MPQLMSDNVYDQVVDVSRAYFGERASRFIDFHIQSHLNKVPQELSRRDLERLLCWTKATLSLVTDDDRLIRDYIASLQAIVDDKPAPKEPKHRA